MMKTLQLLSPHASNSLSYDSHLRSATLRLQVYYNPTLTLDWTAIKTGRQRHALAWEYHYQR